MENEIITVEGIRSLVYTIRGQQVMLDSDLAEIYGYELRAMNQQVKRNIERFPEDFMFQLTKDEVELVKSQIVTSRDNTFFSGQEGGRRKLPYAFTEQGIYMLATVLKGELAVQQSVFIMRAFKEMRHYIMQNQQFVTHSEMNLVTARVSEIAVQTVGLIDHQKQTDKKLEDIQKSIDLINDNFVSDKDYRNFVIYKGQKFEADAAYIDIYRQAQKSIYVIDDYMNVKSLELLSQKKTDVEVILFTENKHGKNGFLTNALITDFNNQYPSLRIKPNPDWHDRLIVLDYNLPTERVFHCGASSKDAGNKICAINEFDKKESIHKIIDDMLSVPDKAI